MQNIGRYHIEGELGKGAMGVVYKATDPNIGRTVALKTMRLDVHGIEAEEMLQRFRNEARAAGVLNHPNIVTIYDAGESDGLFYMAMEVIEGQTLQALLAKNRVLPVEQVLNVTRQVGEGLDFAHSKGVIHRDIKPANIMMTTSGLVKIMDFGIAKAGGGLTSTGQVLGTPNYMSPEQVKGKPLDGRTDLFSLGVVLYEMVTGEKPFGAQNVTTIIYKIVHEEPLAPKEIDSSIHPGLSAIVIRALSKDVNARYQSGADLAKDLDNYQAFGSAAPQPAKTVVADDPAQRARAAAATTVQSPTAPPPAPAAKPAPPKPVAPKPASMAPAAIPAPEKIEIKVKQIAPKAVAQQPQTVYKGDGGGRKGLVFGGIAILLLVLGAFGWRYTHPSDAATTTASTSTPADSSTANPAKSPAGARRAPSNTGAAATDSTNPASTAPPPAGATTGSVTITLKPETASARLDGRKLTGASPITEKDLPPGKHSLQVSAPGYLTANKSVDITAGGNVTADITLVAATGTVRVTSLPAGADIFVDGVDTNKKTPAEFNLAKGDHTFMLRIQGYDEAGDLINVAPGQTISFAPTLFAIRQGGGGGFRKIFGGGGGDKGQLAVTTDPPGAFVFLNGRRVPGETPLNIPAPVGHFFMAIRKPGYRPVQRPLDIDKGKTTNVSQSLSAKEE